MIALDVNVLVYAHREDTTEHEAYAELVRELAGGPEPFAASAEVLAGTVRVVTNRRVFPRPTPTALALDFISEIVALPHFVLLQPGPRCFELFVQLCRETEASGKLVADAHHAALAIDNGCEWWSTDGDFARFPGLRWRHPLGA